jgi:predicted AlkP superfamily phosphohydrolase/phosphomutase
MEEGRLPRLREIYDSGSSGTLYSTVPPITPAAWTTFLTGKQPGRHGILDFEGYDVTTGRLRLNSTQRLQHVRNLWQILSEKGLKVGSVNVPMTYPPVPVNGFVVTGFETPGPESEFAYPAELKREILSRWPDPTLRSKWKSGGDDAFRQNLDYVVNSFRQGVEMTKTLGDRFGWDALMVVFKLVDNLQHKTWKYLDGRWPGKDTERREATRKCFEKVDAAVGELLDYASAHEAAVMIVSDHGHGSQDGKTFPNRLLANWGYLKLRGRAAQAAARSRRILDRLRDRRKRAIPVHDIERHVPVDLAHTRACVMHAGNAGFLYLNLRGRQPTGIVEPDEYERLRDELIARFRGPDCRVRAPWGEEIELFPEVHKPEELYNVLRDDEPWLPDLLLIQHETLAVVRRIYGRKIVEWTPYRRLEGTHRKEGIFFAHGSSMAHNPRVKAQLADCAPTILAMLGLPVPQDMEGRVLTEIFDRPIVVESASAPRTDGRAAELARTSDGEEVYTEAEMAKVTERLSNLGYLE